MNGPTRTPTEGSTPAGAAGPEAAATAPEAVDALALVSRLEALAANLRSTWQREAVRLWKGVDADLWRATQGNPQRILALLGRETVARRLIADPALAALAADVVAEFEEYAAPSAATWFAGRRPPGPFEVAFFAAELAVADALPIYAGGLGAVAGEQLKSASTLGVPMVGVGLLYREASHQWLDDDGRQQESWEILDVGKMPITQAADAFGRPIEATVPFPGRDVAVRVWTAPVGRNLLVLLDCALGRNTIEDRRITSRLYGGDLETRIQQELILGVGGVRALAALGHEPSLLHLNEGHTALAALERIRRLMAGSGLTFAEACQAAAPSLLFTTHTPVAAGHDYFPPELAVRYLAPLASLLGVQVEELLALGRLHPEQSWEAFCPTVLALRLSGTRNGVSRLHGEVTRDQWRDIWPRVPLREVPITHVVNGIHFESWVSPEMEPLLRRAIGPEWRSKPSDPKTWLRLSEITDDELWAVRNAGRERLVQAARRRLGEQLARRGASARRRAAAERVLDPDVLTLGFVGRFVAYKRPTLFLTDHDRLARLLDAPGRPVQIAFAGKAHPRDEHGKGLLRELVSFAHSAGLDHRIVFIEDLDMTMDAALVQGVDVWLNTPRRPLEACGIAGMKAGVNGALNLSTIDGWWDEAWFMADAKAAPIGWCIGGTEEYEDTDAQDAADAESLYRVLEEEVVPAFYERGRDGVPARWLASVRQALATLTPLWDSHRMVQEYTERLYLPAADRASHLQEGGGARARDLAGALLRIANAWPGVGVRVLGTKVDRKGRLEATVEVALNGLAPADVQVDLWVAVPGRARTGRPPGVEETAARAVLAGSGPEHARYTAALSLPAADGKPPAVAARVLPRHPFLADPFSARLIRWSD